MEKTKTIFIGSLFAFEQAGVEDVIERVKNYYVGDHDGMPFISYEQEDHVSQTHM